MSQEYTSSLLKDHNSKFLSKYSPRKSLQVCSSTIPLFSDKFKMHNTHQREIKNILLKTNNKWNRAIGNSVKELRVLQSGLGTLQYYLF